jgi:hypothetical protein
MTYQVFKNDEKVFEGSYSDCEYYCDAYGLMYRIPNVGWFLKEGVKIVRRF